MLPLSITFLIFFQTLGAQGSGDPRPRASAVKCHIVHCDSPEVCAIQCNRPKLPTVDLI